MSIDWAMVLGGLLGLVVYGGGALAIVMAIEWAQARRRGGAR